MEKVLKEFTGKKVDVNCGSNVAYRGEVLSVDDGVVTLKNEDGESVFLSLDKIAAVTECKDHASRPGFVV